MGYDSRFKSQVMDEFFEAILLLKNQEECYRFFEDVCTINELRAMTQRMQVAKLLAEKKTYKNGVPVGLYSDKFYDYYKQKKE